MGLGDNIKKCREELGMMQCELAEKVGVSAPMISWIERGTKSPSLQLGYQIAEALGVSVKFLLGVDESNI